MRLATNYRGISLTPTAAKIYNKLLLHRIRPVLENILRDNQNGFREKRSTTAQIFMLRRILEGVKQKQLPDAIIFVDFSEAFGSPSLSLCTVSASTSSNIDEILSINPSANVFNVFNVNHKDWLTYSGGTDSPEELL